MGCVGSTYEYQPTEVEIEAERHEEIILEAVQGYQEELAAARREIAKAKEAYRLALSEEANRRLGHQSASRKLVHSRQQALHHAEQRHERLRREMQEDMAHLRRVQRNAALSVRLAGESAERAARDSLLSDESPFAAPASCRAAGPPWVT